jgi:hypothetical protein
LWAFVIHSSCGSSKIQHALHMLFYMIWKHVTYGPIGFVCSWAEVSSICTIFWWIQHFVQNYGIFYFCSYLSKSLYDLMMFQVLILQLNNGWHAGDSCNKSHGHSESCFTVLMFGCKRLSCHFTSNHNLICLYICFLMMLCSLILYETIQWKTHLSIVLSKPLFLQGNHLYIVAGCMVPPRATQVTPEKTRLIVQKHYELISKLDCKNMDTTPELHTLQKIDHCSMGLSRWLFRNIGSCKRFFFFALCRCLEILLFNM